MEFLKFFESFWQICDFSLFFVVPFSPLQSILVQTQAQTRKFLDGLQGFASGPNLFGDEVFENVRHHWSVLLHLS